MDELREYQGHNEPTSDPNREEMLKLRMTSKMVGDILHSLLTICPDCVADLKNSMKALHEALPNPSPEHQAAFETNDRMLGLFLQLWDAALQGRDATDKLHDALTERVIDDIDEFQMWERRN